METNLIKHITKLNKNIEKVRKKECIDCDEITLLPLLQYIRTNKIDYPNEIKELLKIKRKNIKKLKFYKITDFLNVSDKIEYYLSEITDELHQMFPNDVDIQSIDFLLYEILLNIYKHSQFKNAYVQIKISKENIIEICIIDDGIGIPNSFKNSLISFDNDYDAIYSAINGETTDKEKYNLHGRGLNSSSRIISLGFNGEMLIASGKGICSITKNGAKVHLNENTINGTFIIMRINHEKIENIYEYLKYESINKIEE